MKSRLVKFGLKIIVSSHLLIIPIENRISIKKVSTIISELSATVKINS